APASGSGLRLTVPGLVPPPLLPRLAPLVLPVSDCTLAPDLVPPCRTASESPQLPRPTAATTTAATAHLMSFPVRPGSAGGTASGGSCGAAGLPGPPGCCRPPPTRPAVAYVGGSGGSGSGARTLGSSATALARASGLVIGSRWRPGSSSRVCAARSESP